MSRELNSSLSPQSVSNRSNRAVAAAVHPLEIHREILMEKSFF